MPCICYGSLSGKDCYDEFLASDKGREALGHIIKAASIIMSHKLPDEGIHNVSDIEFRQMFVKCFLHMMVGCDEEGKPKANP
jgi:hypothetical protein